ncbi:hypothetical protein [Chitinophaga japonensis]|uniref:Lipoprotein n=1 Tax=Chitinophaga japonensis TaxID=104662 RepID=A0A562SZR5_CHIJA|nr:hypothetical protein [Chitinophaga japonensis]TWI86494.1 hypothetical protein LX66_3752 [Chitinophaga japonensis]
MHKLHVLLMLTGGFIIAATACRKENTLQQAGQEAFGALYDSTGHDTIRPPHDTLPPDSCPHDTVPHDTIPYPPHDTVPHPPHDTLPHDTVPYPPHDTLPGDSARYRRP